MKAKLSQGWERGAAFLSLDGTREMREKPPREGDSCGTGAKAISPLSMLSTSRQPAGVGLGGSGVNAITEANTFPSIQRGLCGLGVVHIIGLQDVKCHSRTEPGKGWANASSALSPVTEERRAHLPQTLNILVLLGDPQQKLR